MKIFGRPEFAFISIAERFKNLLFIGDCRSKSDYLQQLSKNDVMFIGKIIPVFVKNSENYFVYTIRKINYNYKQLNIH